MPKKWKSVWPCPVYVATFSDGTMQRMSFASPVGKPLDLARGRRLLAWACAQQGQGWNVPMYAPRTDMIAGYAEHNGARCDDPFFAPNNVIPLKPSRKPRNAPKPVAPPDDRPAIDLLRRLAATQAQPHRKRLIRDLISEVRAYLAQQQDAAD